MDGDASASHHWRSSKAFIIGTVCMAIFTDVFTFAVLVPVLPFVLAELAVPDNERQYWNSLLVTVYGASLLIGSPIFGWISDRSPSRRYPFIFGLLTLGASAALFFAASSLAVLVIARVLEGLSAALVWTTGQALLADTVGRQNIGEALGYVSISISIGSLISPAVGGWLYQSLGYASIFIVLFLLLFVDALLRFLVVETKAGPRSIPPREEGRVDHHPHTVSSNESDRLDESRPLLSKRDGEQAPLYPTLILLLLSPGTWTAIYGLTVQAIIQTVLDSTLPIYLNDVFGWNSGKLGLVFVLLSVGTFAGPLVGRVADKFGPRWMGATMFACGAPLLALLSLINHHSKAQVALLCVLTTITGFFIISTSVPLNVDLTLIAQRLEQRYPKSFQKGGVYAQAYSLFTMSFSAGTLIGPIASASILKSSGWTVLCLLLGGLFLSAVVPILLFTGRERDAEKD